RVPLYHRRQPFLRPQGRGGRRWKPWGDSRMTERRTNRLAFAIRAALAAAAPVIAAPAVAQMDCADLAGLDLPNTEITLAERVDAGTFAPPGGGGPGGGQPLQVPTMCRVAGVVEPAIKFEVWLP